MSGRELVVRSRRESRSVNISVASKFQSPRCQTRSSSPMTIRAARRTGTDNLCRSARCGVVVISARVVGRSACRTGRRWRRWTNVNALGSPAAAAQQDDGHGLEHDAEVFGHRLAPDVLQVVMDLGAYVL